MYCKLHKALTCVSAQHSALFQLKIDLQKCAPQNIISPAATAVLWLDFVTLRCSEQMLLFMLSTVY